MNNAVKTKGYQLITNFIEDSENAAIIKEYNQLKNTTRNGNLRQAENKLPSVKKLINKASFKQAIQPFFTQDPQLIRCLLFDKSTTNNWSVGWHQDKTIATRKKFSEAGWKNWTLKNGEHHVQPPVEILEKLLTIRIHLDEATEENGCLKIIPNSHSFGIIVNSNIHKYTLKKITPCIAAKNSALIMHPLLLHRSDKIRNNNSRRILHLEYSESIFPDSN